MEPECVAVSFQVNNAADADDDGGSNNCILISCTDGLHAN